MVEPVAYIAGIPIAALSVVVCILLIIFGIIGRRKIFLPWLIVLSLTASNIAALVAWALSTRPLVLGDPGEYLDYRTGTLIIPFVILVIKFISMFFVFISFLLLLYIFVLVVHNDLYPSRVNVNRVAGVVFFLFSALLFGLVIFFFHRENVSMILEEEIGVSSILAELCIYLAHLLVCLLLVTYFLVAFFYLRKNPAPQIKKGLVIQVSLVCIVIVGNLLATIFLLFTLDYSPYQAPKPVSALIRNSIFMFINTISLSILVLLSWRTDGVKKDSNDEPLLSAKREEDEAEEGSIPMKYRL